MRITDLNYKQRRTGSEVSATLDDGSTIALDAELAVRFHLARGMELSSELMDEIRQADELLRAKRKLIHYLSLRKKSTSDAHLYLKKHGFSVGSAEQAVMYARDNQYLNDIDFAESFARTRMRAGTKGPRIVTMELQARGIDRDEARKAVQSMTEPETQLEMARKVAAKKYPILKDADNLVKASRRLTQHLARRGFDPEICESVTREYFGEPTQF